MSDLGDLIAVGLLSQKDGLGLTANEAHDIAENIASHIVSKTDTAKLVRVVQAARAYLASDGSGIRAKGRWSAPFDAMDHAHALGRLRKALAEYDAARAPEAG